MTLRLLFLMVYALCGGAACWAAFLFRFYFDPLPFRYDEMMVRLLPFAIGIKAGIADGLGLTRAIWRFASFRDLKSVGIASVAGSLLFVPLALWQTGSGVPNGVLLLDGLLTFGFFTGVRFSGRFWSEGLSLFRGFQRAEKANVLILGGGNRAELALRVLSSSASLGVKVKGILDTNPENKGRSLHGVPILGTPQELGKALMGRDVQEVVLALPSENPEEVRRVFSLASAAGAKVSILPEVSPVENGVALNPIRELRMSDFLGRAPVELDPVPLEKALAGQRVLVTGAGGSIGSELCRQLARLPIAQLTLLDFSETALFEISEEVKSVGRVQLAVGGNVLQGRRSENGDSTQLLNHSTTSQPPAAVPLLCDIRHREELDTVFSEHKPDVVIHAAACKHVPMMETHPLEAARTNVLGTRNVVEAAKAVGVKRLMHVSTDKAVNPEGVMGASKSKSEQVVHAAGYSCVRFGNVLGSSGSVIPLFEKQWTRSGKLQVTHEDATRYFMTIEEAVQLILHAEALQQTGEIYVLDMGEPVRILDLARQMVAMRAGGTQEMGDGSWEMGEGIEIVGLRPGERLHERLHSEEESLEETGIEKIRRIESLREMGDGRWEIGKQLEELEGLVERRDLEGVRVWLMGHSATASVAEPRMH